MSRDQPHEPEPCCANYQLTSFIPRLMSEVNTLISDCQEEADPDQCSTVDIGQAVFSPGLAEVGNQ